MKHSVIVGGSTASRVINCPGSVALVAKMPPKPSSKDADTGTLLHEVIADLVGTDKDPYDFIGRKYEGIELTEELVKDKLIPALKLFEEVDTNYEMAFMVEQKVGFNDLLTGVFGSCDVLGRLGGTAVVLDWKFGSGVAVDAENNYQLMFYARAAMHTEATKWVFEGAKEVELVIIQPPYIKRWKTTIDRLVEFEQELVRAVNLATETDAPLKAGSHCRWCAAKPVCPQMTGAVDRALKVQLDNLPASHIGVYLTQANLLEEWIADLRALAHKMIENDTPVPGWKLVGKRATRQWTDNKVAEKFLLEQKINPYKDPELLSPAGAEKLLKKRKVALPDELIVAVSSGSTLAPESDSRPAVLNVGKQLTQALSKLV